VFFLYAYAYITTPSILLHTNPLSCSKRKERKRGEEVLAKQVLQKSATTTEL
jgi:hypothetical protein